MIQYDQFEDYSPQEVRFANSVEMLLEALYDDEGYVRDIADAEGRKKLIEAIEKMPKEVKATLGKDDRELIRALIKECKDSKAILRTWFWWVVGAMGIAILMTTIAVAVIMAR